MANRKKITFCITSFSLWLMSSFVIPAKDTHDSTSLKNRLSEPRHYSLGHTKSTDILNSMQLLSSCFEIVEFLKSHPKEKVMQSPAWKRFIDNKSKLERISRLSMGFNETYFIPAMIFLFEINDLKTATEVASYGLNDRHVDIRTVLLNAFIAHVFHADLSKASRLYKRLSTFPKAPQWFGKFSQRLATGDDPIQSDPKVRKVITEMIQNFFPQIKSKRRVR